MPHKPLPEAGRHKPNELGLLDMSGMIWEWCEDKSYSDYQGAPADGTAWISREQESLYRVLRGGSWQGDAKGCRTTQRIGDSQDAGLYDYGLRLVCHR